MGRTSPFCTLAEKVKEQEETENPFNSLINKNLFQDSEDGGMADALDLGNKKRTSKNPSIYSFSVSPSKITLIFYGTSVELS